MTEVFYTQNQKDALKEMSESRSLKRVPMSEATGALILDALGEQQNTLQSIDEVLHRIEAILLEQ